MADTQYKIGIDQATEYIFGWRPDPTQKVSEPKTTDAAGITYNGPEVEADNPWLIKVEQGAAGFFDNINGLFAGAAKALSGAIAFIKNYWQLLIIAAVALIIIDNK